jgi:hypothetical protein
MTVSELVEHLQRIQADGGGERVVYMSEPQSGDMAEVTGLWVPGDEAVVDLECVEWRNRQGEVVAIG